MIRKILSLVTVPNARHLAEQYRRMHEDGKFKGQTWRAYLDDLQKVIPDLDKVTIVDFGCGPHGGLAQALPNNTRPYDPYVEKYSNPPWNERFDVLFSSDVLEHVPLRDMHSFFDPIRKASPRYVFLNVSTRWAMKNLPDGTNAHITVKPAEWWLSYVQSVLGEEYVATLARADLLRRDVTLCFQRKQPPESSQVGGNS